MSSLKVTLFMLVVVTCVGLLLLRASYRAHHTPAWSDSYPKLQNSLGPACADIVTQYTHAVREDYAQAQAQQTTKVSHFYKVLRWHYRERTLLLLTFVCLELGVILLGLKLKRFENV